MVLKAILTDLSGLDEATASHYIEKDGQYYLNVEPVNGVALEDVSGLKSSLMKERQNSKDARASLSLFEGVNPDEAKMALSKMDEVANWTPDEKVKEQIEAQARQLQDKHQAQTDKLNNEINTMKGQLQQTLVKTAAMEAITAEGGNVDLLMPIVEQQIRMDSVDGKYIAQVVDENGVPRVSMAQGSVDNMSIAELVSTMKSSERYMPAFAGSGATGSGATGSSTGGGTIGSKSLSWEEAHDPASYRAAKEAAETAGSELNIQSFDESR